MSIGGYNPYGISFPYGGNIAANDYAQQSLNASAAIRSAQQVSPAPVGELLGLMDKIGNSFGSSRLSADPAFNASLDQLTGIPGGIPGYGPAGSIFPNYPLTGMNNDPRRFQFAPQNFPYQAYNPLTPAYPYPMYAGLGQPQYLPNGFSPYASYPGSMPRPIIFAFNPYGMNPFGGYGLRPAYPVLANPYAPWGRMA